MSIKGASLAYTDQVLRVGGACWDLGCGRHALYPKGSDTIVFFSTIETCSSGKWGHAFSYFKSSQDSGVPARVPGEEGKVGENVLETILQHTTAIYLASTM